MNLSLVVTDQDTIAELSKQKDPSTFALAALKIGVLSLRHAGAQLDADLIKLEGDRVLQNMKVVLNNWHAEAKATIKEYFDPEAGRLQERLTNLLKNGGDLEQVIMSCGSLLSRELTNAMSIGLEPMMKQVDPAFGGNLVERMAKAVQETTAMNQKALLEAFSLDNPASALSRLIDSVKKANGDLHQDLGGAIRAVVSELSLDNTDSALTRLRSELMTIIREQEAAAGAFQSDVRAYLAAIASRKEESKKSTSHGMVFEDKLSSFVESACAANIVRRTGATTGIIKNCKIGDIVVELGPDHVASGCRFVVEAKESSAYDLGKAREEIEQGRKNREATVGLFVFSQATRPAGLTQLSRYGSDVFVVWDAEDQTTDPYLTAALSLAEAMCVREVKARSAEAADFKAIDSAVAAVEKEVARLEEIGKWTETIKNNSEKILDHVRKGGNSLVKQVAAIREAIEGLKS